MRNDEDKKKTLMAQESASWKKGGAITNPNPKYPHQTKTLLVGFNRINVERVNKWYLKWLG